MQELLAHNAADLPEGLRPAADLVILPPGDIPIEGQFWQWVSTMHPLQGAMLVGAGLVYLLYGWKIFKVLVLLNAALLGALGGYWLSRRFNLPWWIPLVAAGLLTVGAWPLMRLAVSVMGGLAGAVLGALAWRSFLPQSDLPWVGALAGLAALGILAFIVFRVIVIGFTSVQGALMAVAGLVGMAAVLPRLRGPLAHGLLDYHYALPLLVLVPAAVGFVYQLRHKDRPTASG